MVRARQKRPHPGGKQHKQPLEGYCRLPAATSIVEEMTFGGAFQTSWKFLFVLALAAGSAGADSLVVNGNFTGGLTGWTTFTVPNGLLAASVADIVPPDPIAVPEAEFQATRPSLNQFSDLAGAGISQDVVLPGGDINISVQIAAQGGSSANLFGGMANLLVDSKPVAGYDFGALQSGQLVSASLSYNAVLAAGEHNLGVEFVQPAGGNVVVPFEYVSEFLVDDAVPEPGTIGFCALGVAALVLRRRALANNRRKLKKGRRQKTIVCPTLIRS
jgi:hypothetical protein